MKNKHHKSLRSESELGRHLNIAVHVLFVISVWISPFSIKDASAFGFEVKVTIDGLLAQVSFDSTSETDFYAEVEIDGTTTHNYGTEGQLALENMDTITPGLLNSGRSDWSFTKLVDPTKGSIPIVITIWDEDDFLNGGDDLADIENGPGVSLNLDLDLQTCALSGELSGTCGASLSSMGNGEADGNATIGFTVEIVGFNDAPGLHVHCIHDPIWPQPGQTVKITAVALGDNLRPKVVDEISFTQGTSSSVSEQFVTPVSSYTAGPFNGPDFNYSCTAINDANNDGTLDPDEIAFSGYRTVSVGVPMGSQAVPVILTGPEDMRHDVVLIPDNGYSGAMDGDFLLDARNMIDLYYLSGEVFLDNQDKINFWIAQDEGAAGGYDQPDCKRVPPTNWDTDYAFSNAGMIIHRKDLRDCASDGVASAQSIRFVAGNPVSYTPFAGFAPFVHELGHALFSLADEYCNTRGGANPGSSCDGGYRQISTNPNVFDNAADCETDRAADPNGGAKTCQSFVSQNSGKSNGKTFHTFDPPTRDLMVDNKLPQYLDNRRIDGVFSNCTGC